MTDISPVPPRTYGFVDRSSAFTQAAQGYNPAPAGLSQSLSNVDTARQMRMVINNYPELGNDPGTLVGVLAGGGNDEQVFLRASQAISTADMANFADTMRQDDPVTQRAKWFNLDRPRQAALRQLGYEPPPVHPDDEGGWTIGIAGHDLFSVGGEGVVGTATAPLSFGMDAVAGFLGRSVDLMGNVADFPAHIARATAAQTEAPGRSTAGEYGALFNLSEWGNSWSRTSDGAHFFHSDHEEAARDYLDDHPWDEARLGAAPDPELRFTVARSLAAGDSASDYARSLGLNEDRNPTEWHAAVLKWEQLVADPEVRRAGQDLENGHMTMGRTVLRAAGVNDYHSPYAMLASGGIDAWLAFRLDPVIFLSKAHTASNVMRYGVRLDEAAADLDKTVRYARAWDVGREEAVKAMYRAEGGVMDSSYRQSLARARHFSAKAKQYSLLDNPETAQRLLRDSPDALLTAPSIYAWKEMEAGNAILTPDRVYDFWQSSLGTESIVKTTGLRSHKVRLLPHLTPIQQAGLQAKGFMTDAVNIMAEAGTTAQSARALLPESSRLAAQKFGPDSIDSMEQLFLDKALAPVGRFMQAITTHGPYRQGLLDLGNPDSAAEIQRFVNLGQIVGMPEAERFAWNAKMLGDYNPVTGKVGFNKALAQGTALEFLDRLMEMGGIAGEDFAKRFVGRAEQMYGLSPESYVRVGDTTTRSGVFSIDTANGMAIPSPMELIQATRTQSATKSIFGAITASPLESTFTRVWKPLTLMHMGFIPRIAGEELLGFTLRKGPINAGRNVLARWASEYEPALEVGGGMVRRADPEFMATLPIKWMTSHLQDWTREYTEVMDAAGKITKVPKPASQLNLIAGALDGYVERLALYGHDVVHGVASRFGIPDRRELMRRFVGQRTLDNYYEAMNSKAFRRAGAEHMSGAYWGHPDNEIAFHSQPIDVWRGNKRLRMWMPLRDDVAAQKAYARTGKVGEKLREQNTYADIYMNALQRKTAARDAQVGLKTMHLTTDNQVTRIDRALTDMGYAPEVPIAMSREEFIREYDELNQRVMMAEKRSSPSTWTAEMHSALEEGDYRRFSELRGYTPDEIAEYDRFREFRPIDVVRSPDGPPPIRVPYPKGSPNEGTLAQDFDPGDLYDALIKKGRTPYRSELRRGPMAQPLVPEDVVQRAAMNARGEVLDYNGYHEVIHAFHEANLRSPSGFYVDEMGNLTEGYWEYRDEIMGVLDDAEHEFLRLENFETDNNAQEAVQALRTTKQSFLTLEQAGTPEAKAERLVGWQAKVKQNELEQMKAAMEGAAVELPPIPEGHIRLFRGERRPFEETGRLPEWMAHTRGRWFTSDVETAHRYATPTGGTFYVDIPEEQAAAFATNLPGEFVLPVETADLARQQRITFFQSQGLAGKAPTEEQYAALAAEAAAAQAKVGLGPLSNVQLASKDPLDRIKAFKGHLDNHLGPQGREIVYDIIDGTIPKEEALAALNEGMAKASTVEQRFALRNLANMADNPSLRHEDLGLLANDRLKTHMLSTDRAQVTADMARAHENFLYDPANAEIVSDLILANYHNGTPVVAPITQGSRPLYVPMVDGQTVQKLRGMAIDPAERERLRAALVQTFTQRKLDPDAIDHILDGIAATDENARRAHGTLLASQAMKRNDRLVPAGLWGSNDDRVADAVTDTINRVAAGNRDATLGVAAVPKNYWDHAAYPDAGLHAGPGRSYAADNFLLTNPEALEPSQRLTMSKVTLRSDGSTRWVDDEQLRRMSARKELEVGDDGRPVVIETQQRAGTSASMAIKKLARLQATDLLDRLAPTDNGVLHSLLEPMTRGPKWTQDPKGVWNELPSHLNLDHYIAADGNLMPPTIYGPEKVGVQHTRWEKLTNFWFEGAVQPALSAMSRNPMAVQAYGESARLARGLFGDAWIPENIRGSWGTVKTKIGLSAKDEQTLFREWDRLPATLTDPDASVANFTKVLGNLLGTKLHTTEEALRLAELEKGAVEATKVGIPSLRRLMNESEGMTEEAANAIRAEAFKANQAANAERIGLKLKLEGSAEFLPQDMRTFRSYTRARLNVERHIDEIASQSAMQSVVPYIHDPSVRSHFQSYVGTLMPFQFAEEQFLKRWAKTFIDDPGAARKLMILHDGLRNTGIVEKDPFTGEDVFIWPGSDVLNQVMAKANVIWPGAGTFRGLAYAPLSGTTSMIIPGFGEPVAPNLGPAAGLALHGITHLFPEFAPLEDTMASDRANPDRNVMEWIVPSHLQRIYESFMGDVDSGQLASLGKNSIAYLTAHGQGPPVEGTEHERQAWLDKVKNLSRSQLLLRGVFGLLGPSGGTTVDYHDALADDYRRMLSEGLSPEEAFGIFVAKHKGEVDPETVFPAYTVFATKTAAGAKLPQTQEALDFLTDNSAMVQNFPLGMSWLMPQAESGAPRVRQAYAAQMRNGLRSSRTPGQFMDQILFAEGADTYFDWYDEHKARVTALPVGSQALADENDNWKIRADTWKAQNPVFAKMLEDPTASQRREGVREELGQLLVQPVPGVNADQAAELKAMMDGWSKLQQSLDALKFSRRTTAVQKLEKELPQRFIAWAHAYLAVHPRVTSFYNSVLRPDLPDEVIARG